MMKRLFAALAFVSAAFLGSQAQAFDTGPHAAITEQAMAMAGYNRSAADAVMVENWLTDYYTSSPTRGSLVKCDLEKLHFDTLFTPAEVDAYWNTLTQNTVRAALKARADNNRYEFYAVLGVSLHAVQDFYSHSNWVETSGFNGAGYDTSTYFQWRQGGAWRRQGEVHTGWYDNCLKYPKAGHDLHGDYTSGMNHDSINRPDHAKAYVYALAASYEWLSMVRQALIDQGGKDFADSMQTYTPAGGESGALAADQLAALYISEWVTNPNPFGDFVDGHWNGRGSGALAPLAAVTASWAALPDSPFVVAFKTMGVPASLSQGLYSTTSGAAPSVPLSPTNVRLADVRLGEVCSRRWDPAASYFGVVTPTVAGQRGYPIRSSALLHASCPKTNWQYLVPIPSGDIAMNFALFNEYSAPNTAKAIDFDDGATNINIACSAGSGVCRWGGASGTDKPMNAPLKLKGGWWNGASLGPLSVQIVTASPWRP